MKLTTEEFIERYNKKMNGNPKIQIISEYMGTNKPIKCKCILDGFEWETTPHSLMHNSLCPKCSKTSKLLSEDYIDAVNKINPDVEIIGEYKAMRFKIKCRCKIDGYEWESYCQNLLKGHRCPHCKQNYSIGEKIINNELKLNNIAFIEQYKFDDCKNIRRLSFDFYIPDYNLCI